MANKGGSLANADAVAQVRHGCSLGEACPRGISGRIPLSYALEGTFGLGSFVVVLVAFAVAR